MTDSWHDLYVMFGSSSAALLGLLFVAASMHLDEARKNPVFERRARNNTRHLLVLLVEAALILMPQPPVWLGAELVAINLLGLWIPASFTYRAYIRDKEIGRRGGWALHRALAYMMGYLLAAAGGAALIAQAKCGLYLVTASYIIILAFVVLNAWTILMGIGQKEKVRK